MTEHHHEGGCLCGAVRYGFSGTPRFQSMCHCRSCRRAIGAPAAAFVGLTTEQFEQIKGSPTIYESSPGVERGFCSHCGTSLTFAGAQWPGEVHIYTATLDEPDLFPPTVHSYCVDQLTWFDPVDDLPRREHFGASKANQT